MRNDKVQRTVLSHAYKCRSLLQDIKIKKKKKQLSIDEELTFEESILLVVQK